MRILFSIQLLFKTWVLNRLGFVNCDIKLENILSRPDSDYKEVFFVDSGFIQREKTCSGGSEDFQPPETKYQILNEYSPE
jgi:hypothetical protein